MGGGTESKSFGTGWPFIDGAEISCSGPSPASQRREIPGGGTLAGPAICATGNPVICREQHEWQTTELYRLFNTYYWESQTNHQHFTEFKLS